MTDVRVLLADDHAIVRAGLAAVLAGEDGVDVVAQAGTADAAVERARLGDVDVVLMDLRFGGQESGIDATRRIRERAGAPQVLVLTSFQTDAEILGAIDAGACGYLLKDTDPDVLVAAVRAAAAGESALSPSVATALLGRLRTPGPELTDRELEVLRAVESGVTNRQIANALVVSEATVKTHLVHLYAKLGVSSRTAAVSRGRELGLV